jgi:hypothetical protein
MPGVQRDGCQAEGGICVPPLFDVRRGRMANMSDSLTGNQVLRVVRIRELKERLAEAERLLRWTAPTVHMAHLTEDLGWEDCGHPICDTIQSFLERKP